MYWTDGSIYKGEWVKGIQHGYGEMIFPDGTKKVGMFDHNTYVPSVEDGQLNTQQILAKISNSQERKLNPLIPSQDSVKLKLKNMDIRISTSNSKLRPIESRKNNDVSVDKSYDFAEEIAMKNSKFNIKKLSSPLDTSTETVLRSKNSTQKKPLPPLEPRTTTQGGVRKLNKLTENNSNTSFDVGLLSDKALKLLEMNQKKLKNTQKPIWKPSGSIAPKDGYLTVQKQYY